MVACPNLNPVSISCNSAKTCPPSNEAIASKCNLIKPEIKILLVSDNAGHVTSADCPPPKTGAPPPIKAPEIEH